MDSQRNHAGAPCGGVVVLHSEVPESGWVSVDLTAYEALASRTPTFAPQAAGAGSGTPSEPSPAPPDGLEEKTIIKARLVAWAERLRGSETVGRDGRPEASPEAALELGAVAVRRVPPPDIITIDRKAIRRARAPGLRLLAAPARADDVRPAAPLKPGIFRSRRMRLLLLGLAAAYLVTGLAHSFARWKAGRVIVVPATIDGRTVIT